MNTSRSIATFLIAASALFAEKITDDDRIRLIRGLTAEFANAKVPLPRSKKPLEVNTTGQYRQSKWDEAMKENGQAAKVGDQVQITRVSINDEDILLEINGGLKNGRSWRDRIQVGMGTGNGGGMNPIGSGKLAAGTSIALKFDKPLESTLEVAQVKKYLTPIFDFDKHSATESFVENLPPEIQEAIKSQKVIEGMDKEQVILAIGRPRYKSRETKDGLELEDWVFGQAPGKITFVTFNGNKVTKVKETYASMGGDLSAAPPKE